MTGEWPVTQYYRLTYQCPCRKSHVSISLSRRNFPLTGQSNPGSAPRNPGKSDGHFRRRSDPPWNGGLLEPWVCFNNFTSHAHLLPIHKMTLSILCFSRSNLATTSAPPSQPVARDPRYNPFAFVQPALHPNLMPYVNATVMSPNGPVTTGSPKGSSFTSTGAAAAILHDHGAGIPTHLQQGHQSFASPSAAAVAGPSSGWPQALPLQSQVQGPPPFQRQADPPLGFPTAQGLPDNIPTGNYATNTSPGGVQPVPLIGGLPSWCAFPSVKTEDISTIPGDSMALSTTSANPVSAILHDHGAGIPMHPQQQGHQSGLEQPSGAIFTLSPPSPPWAASGESPIRGAKGNPPGGKTAISGGEDLVLDGASMWHGTLDPETAAAALAPVQRVQSSDKNQVHDGGNADVSFSCIPFVEFGSMSLHAMMERRSSHQHYFSSHSFTLFRWGMLRRSQALFLA